MPNPIKPPIDDLEDVQTAWGLMPKWKARALALGEIQAVVNAAARNDALERKAADAAAQRKAAAHALERHEHYQRLYARLDAAEARCDALLEREKAKQAAHAALMAAEALYTAQSEGDDE
jgi:hypothetical protein